MQLNRRSFLKVSMSGASAAIASLQSGHNASGESRALDLPHGEEIPEPRGLKLSANRRFLCDKSTGQPFFLLTDTAWNLNALTYEDIDRYLRDRAAHKFSGFMFTLNFYPQAQAANAYGQKAYTGADRTELNPKYFDYCDYIIRTAAKYRLYAIVLAMWGGEHSGTMNTYTARELHTIGLRVGARLKHHENVILVAGGESSPPNIAVHYVNAIGSGLKAGCGGKHLVSVHPCGNRSCSEFFAESPWLDFYMIQGSSSRHGRYYDMTRLITHDYHLKMIKPTMIAENYYESGTTEPAVRQRRGLYLSVLAGGFGCAYGHDAIWQMTPHTGQPWMLTGWPPGVANWKDALNTRAVEQLHHIRRLLYSRPYFSRIPDQSCILAGQGKSIADRVQAARDGTGHRNDATYIMAYMAAPADVTLDTRVISGRRINIWWFDPATGRSRATKMNAVNTGTMSATKPRREGDAVIVVDDAMKHYPPP